METEPGLRDHRRVWLGLEIVCTSIFVLEYLVRMSVCFQKRQTKWEFIKQPMNVADLIAITPLFLELAVHGGKTKFLKLLRSVRLVRLTRIFRMSHYYYSKVYYMMSTQSYH